MKINPVWRKELMLSMRSIRFPLTLSISIGVLSGLLILVFDGILSSVRYGGNLSGLVGLYFTVTLIEFILIGMISPTLTASAICGERERGTLDILLSTKMSPLSIILGKLLASLSKVVLLIIASTPVFAITLSLGGVSIVNIIQMILLYIMTAIFCGSVGLFFSSVLKSTKSSTAASYGLLIFLAIGTLIITVLYYSIKSRAASMAGQMFEPNIPFWLYLNPGLGYGSVVYNQLGIGTTSIINGLNQFKAIGSAWIYNIAVEIVLTILLLWGAAVKLNPLKKRRKKK
ncbi:MULTISPECIES: ABC transporter permease [Clostridium]|uniref:ABC-2 family transporter protein n=1 Tax=Clostridium intestinale DSM 6191 TaxID=1121320 RepID=A0A1M5ZM53_9CLOT|nr:MULTISPECIES: ABC transporter permease subunit [Clostridium]SHI25397.1 ABC-2 family transporter protein [Clostridium intestinale DSM 6191]